MCRSGSGESGPEGEGVRRVDGSEEVGRRSTEMKEREDGRRMEKKSGKELEERSCQEKMMEEEEEGGRYRRCLERMKELLRKVCRNGRAERG